MTHDEIESLLRKAPRPPAPRDLRERLVADIELPRQTVMETFRDDRNARSWFRRWFPVLAYSLILLSCVTILAVQANHLGELRRENNRLRQVAQNLEQLREANAEHQRLVPLAREAERLRKANPERPQWEQDVARLRAALGELPALRAENERLRAEIQAAAEAASAVETDPFAEARRKAQRIACVSHLKQIGLAARIWSNDNGDFLPTTFQIMSNELSTVKVLLCPSDSNKVAAPSWPALTAANISYEFLSPGVAETNSPSAVIFRCPIHDNVGLLDGSVHQLKPGGYRLEQRGSCYFVVQ